MKQKLFALIAFLLVTVIAAHAQQPASDPIGEAFFPPELVMQHQQTIGLTDQQKTFLKTTLRKAQTQFTELQWQLSDESEKLAAMVKQEPVDEQAVLAQLDKVLNAEREIKRTQLSLVIQIRNNLTPEQRARLNELRKGK
ncbi:MAG TPA: periplasmic heavy metal sensor [Blastocatellia bacterium]|nr:periplasmic heavy metal sensor [Blastocatellia bacterium]